MYIIKYSVFHLFDCALRLVLRRVNHAFKYIVLIIIDMYEKSYLISVVFGDTSVFEFLGWGRVIVNCSYKILF